jgi:hypothetical protein
MNANFCKKIPTDMDDSRWISVYDVTNKAKNDKLKVQILKCPFPQNPDKMRAVNIEKM